MASPEQQKEVMFLDERLKASVYEMWRGPNSSPRVSMSPSPRVSMSLSEESSIASPTDLEFEIRHKLSSPPSRRQLRELWQLRQTQLYTDSASPKGASLTPESRRHALYSPVSSGPWRSASQIPTSESEDECWNCQRLKAENHRLKAENHRLRVQLTNYNLFEASP